MPTEQTCALKLGTMTNLSLLEQGTLTKLTKSKNHWLRPDNKHCQAIKFNELDMSAQRLAAKAESGSGTLSGRPGIRPVQQNRRYTTLSMYVALTIDRELKWGNL